MLNETDLRNARVWGAFQAWADELRSSSWLTRRLAEASVVRRLLRLADELYPAKTAESAIEEAQVSGFHLAEQIMSPIEKARRTR